MTIQDFCNLLDGGLVSFSTLSAGTLSALTGMSSGAVICVYSYDAKDVVGGDNGAMDGGDASSSSSSSSSSSHASIKTNALPPATAIRGGMKEGQ